MLIFEDLFNVKYKYADMKFTKLFEDTNYMNAIVKMISTSFLYKGFTPFMS